jgi:hypothetical protein
MQPASGNGVNRREAISMKKQTLVLSALAILFFSAGSATAHPPSAIRLSFDPTSRILDVVVMHDTRKPLEHYIESIVVQLNGKEIIKQKFAGQSDALKQCVTYRIDDAKPGDEIAVTGTCNVFGKKKETIKP